MLLCDDRQPLQLVPAQAPHGNADADRPEIVLLLLEPTCEVFLPGGLRRFFGEDFELPTETFLDLEKDLIEPQAFNQVTEAHLMAIVPVAELTKYPENRGRH